MGCPDGGCDFVSLYDGPDANSPLLGQFSGQPAPDEMPVVVSTGQDMFVRFQTDTSNCGIAAAGQTGDPGFVRTLLQQFVVVFIFDKRSTNVPIVR